MEKIEIQIPTELLELGVQYTGFYEQEEITDKGEWVKELVRREFKARIQSGLERERANVQQNAIIETMRIVNEMDLSVIR